MNIAELWDTVILRDALGYTVPGAVILFGLALLSTVLGVESWGPCLRQVLPGGEWVALVVGVAVSYMLGHVETWVGARVFGALRPSKDVASDLLQESLGETAGRAVIQLLARENQETEQGREDDCKAGGKPDPVDWSTTDVAHLRRVAGYYVQHTAPDLHRVYVGRPSVLAQFCRNTAISLMVLVLCLLIVILRSDADTPPLVIGAVVSIVAAPMLLHRYLLLRRDHIKQTFEVFYTLWMTRAS